MKKLVALVFLLLASAVGLQAEVILPESGRLAGPLNTAASEFGDEFFFFPEFIGNAAPGQTAQNGSLQIQFGTPDGPLVPFQIFVDSVGPDEEIEFSGGQVFVLADNELSVFDSFGLLNLETGVVEEIVVGATFENSGISRLGKLNRLFNNFNHIYPPDLTGFPLPPFPPGFNHAEASFIYDTEGRITGFDFTGLTLVPAGLFGFAGLAPYSFGANNEAFFANPAFCVEGTPAENCPDDLDNRNGIPLLFPTPANPQTLPSTLHPHVFLRSEELREVPVTPDVPACAPTNSAGAVGVSVGGHLYQIGGILFGPDRGRVNVYDLDSGVWQEGERMAVPVVEAQGAAIGDQIYVFGGRRNPRGPANNILQVLDTGSGEWDTLTGAPKPIASGAAVAYGERLYVFSGLTNRPNGSPAGNLRFADYVQIYDPDTDSWEVFDAELDGEQILVAGATAVSDGVLIYLIGGRTMADGVSNQMLIFDALNNRFFTGRPALWNVYGASAARIGKRIYVSGGRSELDGPSERRLQVYEIERGSWIRGLPQPAPTAESAYAGADSRLYVIGGYSMGGVDSFPGPESCNLQYFDPARGWQVCDSVPIFTGADIFSTAALAAGPLAFAPGTQMTIDGHHLADASAFASPFDDVPTELGGVSVTVGGEPAPVLQVSPTRIDFQIPYGVRTDRLQDVVVTRSGAESKPVTISVVDVAPHIFIQSCGELRDLFMIGDAAALACHPDGSLNYPAFPVAPGGTVLVQMTGLGAIDTELGNGVRAPADTVISAETLPTVIIERPDHTFQEATVVSATLAPGELGVYDVEIVVPADTFISNRTYIQAMAGGVTSNLAGVAVGTPTTDDPVGCRRDSNPFFRACFPEPTPPGSTIYLNQF